MSGRQLIRMRGIVKRFYVGQPNELEILHGIDLDVNEGEFVSIVGASGSGKSTLMNMIGVLDRPTEGTYWLDGTDVEDAADDELSQIRNRKIGFVFQNFNLISRTNALRNVELPMMYAGLPQKKRTQRAEELLDLVGMGDRMLHQPNELSGGAEAARGHCAGDGKRPGDHPRRRADGRARQQNRPHGHGLISPAQPRAGKDDRSDYAQSGAGGGDRPDPYDARRHFIHKRRKGRERRWDSVNRSASRSRG